MDKNQLNIYVEYKLHTCLPNGIIAVRIPKVDRQLNLSYMKLSRECNDDSPSAPRTVQMPPLAISLDYAPYRAGLNKCITISSSITYVSALL